jgi:hypothetical protein
MNRYKAIGSALLFTPALALFSMQARAEFKCDAPPSRIDRVACEHAAQSPDALRQYIERMRGIESLYFFDYVNEARAREWAANRPATPAVKPAPQLLADQLEKPGA